MSVTLKDKKGLLIDLDGVLYEGDRVLEGAREALAFIRKQKIPCRFTTNTTVRSVKSLYDKMIGMGFEVSPDEIHSAVKATVLYLRQKGNPTCHLLLTDDPMEDFKEFPQADEKPEYVVIGDIGKRWDYELMNDIFHKVINGAEIIALHKGKYWQTERGLQVDMGAFIAGLEYVTGKEATVIGKPNRKIFELALADMGIEAYEAAMLGDDIDSDIGGAQEAGLTGVLVKTGKYRVELAAQSPVTPDLEIDTIRDIINLL